MKSEALEVEWDVVVVGGGPAGLAAAADCAKAGLKTLLADENPAAGGQIYRAIGSTPLTQKTILGEDFWKGRRLVEEAEASGAKLLFGAVVWSVDPDLVVALSHAGRSRTLQARRVILATGALERPFPIPGWTLPGVMTVGAAQALLKTSGIVPEGRTVIAGMGPLLWLYACQVLRAGGRIDAILETKPRRNALRALPYAPGLLFSPLLKKGLQLVREVRNKVRVIKSVTGLAVQGDERARRVRAESRGGIHEFDVDTVLLHQGVVPNVNLAMAAGVAHRWNRDQLCWSPELDRDGNTSVDGIAVAGDGAGIAGAWAAEQRGRLAALAAVRTLKPQAASDDQATRQALMRHERGRRFLDEMYRPAETMRLPGDGTIVCRCEEVTAGEIRRTTALGCEGPNQLKAFLRCGMGPCQGRLCGLSVTELMADERRVSPESVGYFRLRPPVKPVTLAEIAGMPASEQAKAALVR